MNMLVTLLPVGLVLVLFAATTSAFQGVDLANLREWTIVVADDAIESERYAASELQRFYQQASGVELPIVSTTDRADRHIFVGSGAAMRASNVGFDTSSMGEEALRIIVTPNNIAIAGGRPRGTLYGVYTFLEDYLGVRFLTPDHNHVPPVGDSRPVAAVDRTYDPPIVFRWSYWHATNEHPDFAARMRCNAVANGRPELGDISRHQLINHSLHHWINTKEFGKTHPEYFALVEGQRRASTVHAHRGGDAYGDGTQLCMTNPDVIRILRQRVLQKLRDTPALRLIQLGQGDNEHYCRCDSCAAIDAREESHMGALLTGVNQVAEAVAQEFPDAVIGTLAYKYSSKPPKTLRARDNVRIQLCSIECSVTRPLTDPTSTRNVEFVQYMRLWRERAAHISVWTYATNFWEFLLPGPSLSILDDNIRHYVDSGVSQFFVQGNRQSPGGAFGDETNYVVSRLLWNPSLNGDELLDEFLTLHYGRAGVPLRHYLDRISTHARTLDKDRHCYGRAADFGIDDAMVQAGLAVYEQANALADNDGIRRRLDLFKLWTHRAAIEDAWVAVDPRHMSPRQPGESTADWLERIGIARGAIEPQVRERTRPFIRDMWKVLGTHHVTHWREGLLIEQAEEYLRHGFAIDAAEAW